MTEEFLMLDFGCRILDLHSQASQRLAEFGESWLYLVVGRLFSDCIGVFEALVDCIWNGVVYICW